MELVAHIPGSKLRDFDYVERIVSLGLGVELQITSDILDSFSFLDFGKLLKVVGSATVTVHAPFLDLNPGSVDSYILDATRRRFRETVEVARFMEAKVIVFHSGYHPAKVDPIYDRWFSIAVGTFKWLSEISSIPIAIENVFDRNPRVLEQLLHHLPESVGVCIDVGHINLFSEVPLRDWIERLSDRVVEFHVHSNNGERDEHAPLGSGGPSPEELFAVLKSIDRKYIFNLENKRIEDVESSLMVLRRLNWLEI